MKRSVYFPVYPFNSLKGKKRKESTCLFCISVRLKEREGGRSLPSFGKKKEREQAYFGQKEAEAALEKKSKKKRSLLCEPSGGEKQGKGEEPDLFFLRQKKDGTASFPSEERGGKTEPRGKGRVSRSMGKKPPGAKKKKKGFEASEKEKEKVRSKQEKKGFRGRHQN